MPFVPGSSMKGALRADFKDDEFANEIFGPQSSELGRNDADVTKEGGSEGTKSDTPIEGSAGAVIFTDAVLVALPVRSKTLPFRHVTCPLQISRLSTHLEVKGLPRIELPNVLEHALSLQAEDDKVILEDLRLPLKSEPQLVDVVEILQSLAPSAISLKETITLVDDQTFRWLAAHALPVRARNSLTEDKTVKSGALWYEEYLPPGTLLSCLWGKRHDLSNDQHPLEYLWDREVLSNSAEGPRFLQVGGNETVGLGWFRLTMVA